MAKSTVLLTLSKLCFKNQASVLWNNKSELCRQPQHWKPKILQTNTINFVHLDVIHVKVKDFRTNKAVISDLANEIILLTKL